jgi:hypothetical protein
MIRNDSEKALKITIKFMEYGKKVVSKCDRQSQAASVI